MTLNAEARKNRIQTNAYQGAVRDNYMFVCQQSNYITPNQECAGKLPVI